MICDCRIDHDWSSGTGVKYEGETVNAGYKEADRTQLYALLKLASILKRMLNI